MDYRTSLQTGNNNLAISQSVDQEALHNSRPSGVVSSEVAKLNGYSVSADAGNAKKVVSAGEGAATAVAAASIHDYQVDPVHCEKQLFNDDDTILLYPARNFELKLDFTGIKDSLEWVKTGHHFPDIEKKLPRDVVAFLNIATHRKDGKRLKSSPCLDNPCLDNMLISFSPEDYQPIGRLHYSVSRNTGKKTNNNDSFSKYSCAMDEREKGIVGLWLVEWLKQNNQQDLSMDFGNPPIPCEYGMYKNGFIVMCSHSGNEVCKEEYEYNSEVGQCESFPVFYKYPPCSMVTRIETGYKG